MSIIAPNRTLDQRMAALQRANAIRVVRARLKESLNARTASALTVLVDPAPELATMKVRDLLIALPQWGARKADRFMVACRISHIKTIGGLSDRQREEISALLRERGIS